MPSLRGQLLLFLMKHRHLFRGRLKPQHFDDGSTKLADFRKSVNRVPKHFGSVPDSIRIESTTVNNLYMEMLQPVESTTQSVILYFHGGGYVAGNCRMHRMHVAKVVNGTGIRSLLFDYRLAPEHTFPAALDDALAAYQHLLNTGFSESNIAFMGDSAGGGLCLATLLAAKTEGLPMPSSAVALSPWLDLACTSESYKTVNDPLSPQGSWTAFSNWYVGDNDPFNPLISPFYGDLSGLPPLLLFVGEHEVFRDELIQFTESAKRAGISVVSHIGHGMFHCYPICAPLFPEATSAMNELCAFIKNHMP